MDKILTGVLIFSLVVFCINIIALLVAFIASVITGDDYMPPKGYPWSA